MSGRDSGDVVAWCQEGIPDIETPGQSAAERAGRGGAAPSAVAPFFLPGRIQPRPPQRKVPRPKCL